MKALNINELEQVSAGAWYNPFSWFSKNDDPTPTTSHTSVPNDAPDAVKNAHKLSNKTACALAEALGESTSGCH